MAEYAIGASASDHAILHGEGHARQDFGSLVTGRVQDNFAANMTCGL